MKSNHAVTSNEESHMAASEEKRLIWKVFIKWNTKLNSYIIQLSINAERKFQIKYHCIELPINRGFSYEKKGKHLERKHYWHSAKIESHL